jgi:hypothetical protein
MSPSSGSGSDGRIRTSLDLSHNRRRPARDPNGLTFLDQTKIDHDETYSNDEEARIGTKLESQYSPLDKITRTDEVRVYIGEKNSVTPEEAKKWKRGF